MKKFALASGFTLLLTLPLPPASAEEFTFDASEFEKKPLEFSGYLEQKGEVLKLRGDSPAYRLAYPGKSSRNTLLRSTTTLEGSGKLNLEPFVADVRVQASNAVDALDSTTLKPKVMEGGLRWSAGPELSIDLGKRVQRWGKGYAWTPTGFVERQKDPSDPLLAREGFEMASVEWSKRFETDSADGLSSIALTGLVLPTSDHLNTDFGSKKSSNPAARLYLLAFDTDIDLMWRGKGARPESYGFDFSRNINPALEVHGEWARTVDATRNTITASGTGYSQLSSFNSWLLGFRYITPGEVTWVGEYYRNGAGYSAGELDDYFHFLGHATANDAPATLAAKARQVAQSGYGRPNPGREYLYLKASVSEPFDWLYGAVSISAITNLRDNSYQITPEVSYTGFKDTEIRARLMFIDGKAHSEFGEKTLRNRLEIYAKFFF